MNQRSLEDLIALIEARNMTLAARRRNISQSAYSRRLQAIEARHVMPLVDRSKRPAVPTVRLDAMRTELEAALSALKELDNHLARGASDVNRILSIAAVHTLSSGPLPIAISKIREHLTRHHIRLRSANQDVCFQLLMTEEVSMMLAYETVGKPLQAPPDLAIKTTIVKEQMVPVCAPELLPLVKSIAPGEGLIPLIAYPATVFLGQVLRDDVLAGSPHYFSPRLVAGMTGTIIASTRAGIGVGWLPVSAIRKDLAAGSLVMIDRADFPKADLTISMLQLKTRSIQEFNFIWNALGAALSETIMDTQTAMHAEN